MKILETENMLDETEPLATTEFDRKDINSLTDYGVTYPPIFRLFLCPCNRPLRCGSTGRNLASNIGLAIRSRACLEGTPTGEGQWLATNFH